MVISWFVGQTRITNAGDIDQRVILQMHEFSPDGLQRQAHPALYLQFAE